jgi:hypothetical protein
MFPFAHGGEGVVEAHRDVAGAQSGRNRFFRRGEFHEPLTKNKIWGSRSSPLRHYIKLHHATAIY